METTTRDAIASNNWAIKMRARQTEIYCAECTHRLICVFVTEQQQLYRESPHPVKPDWLKMNSFQNFDQSASLNISAEGGSWSVECRQLIFST